MSASMAAETPDFAGDDYAAPPVTRMGIAVLALVGVLVATYLSLYKLGLIGGLTCQVGSCEQVQNSPWATFIGLPVSVWGVGAYLAILAVALVGLQPRFVNERWVALSLFGLAAVGVAFSGYLTWIEAFVIEMWCQWCVVSAVIITLIFLLSIPGLKRAR
ncbi:MAG TPA: vitamin K epoxide reductase family protein [Longimicrobium sp.]|nr:vitamin K epoxide reductase family protein [Longimicrobium sp.]